MRKHSKILAILFLIIAGGLVFYTTNKDEAEIQLAVEEQVDEATAAAGKAVSTTVRLDPERHDRLRTVAFHTRRSMHSLLVEGVDLVLAKHGGK